MPLHILYVVGKAVFQSNGAYFFNKGLSEDVAPGGSGGLNWLTGLGISKKLGIAFKSAILSSISSSSSE